MIELADRPDRPIVLIERRFPPPGWAIPGGFVDIGEPIEAAAVREALEETDLFTPLSRDATYLREVAVNDGAHPRGRGYARIAELVAASPSWWFPEV